MKAHELENLFGEWRQLTQAEGRAIAGDDWAEVQRQQQIKADLQVRLSGATKTWWNLWSDIGEARNDFERQFRPIITELVALEAANIQHVAARRENAKREFAECDRATGNLRGLNRAYGASASGHWTSYS